MQVHYNLRNSNTDKGVPEKAALNTVGQNFGTAFSGSEREAQSIYSFKKLK